MWYEKRIMRERATLNPRFSHCCSDGKVVLLHLINPPKLLDDLFNNRHKHSKHFKENIQAYNMMFAFTSMGGKIDASINNGRGRPSFILGGVNYHLIGSLLPPNNDPPKLCQVYIYDTEEEIRNRKKAVR